MARDICLESLEDGLHLVTELPRASIPGNLRQERAGAVLDPGPLAQLYVLLWRRYRINTTPPRLTPIPVRVPCFITQEPASSSSSRRLPCLAM